MQSYTLQKGFGYKLFMLLAFTIFASVMYQGHLRNETIYSILFFGSSALVAYQIASMFYVMFIKRTVDIEIDKEKVNWKIYDNKKLHQEQTIKRDDIVDVKTEINYLTGNIYSTFTVTFILKNEEEIILTDGMLYDFGLKKAEEVCRFLLDNELGDKQDIKFSKLIKSLNLNIKEEQIFTKKDGKSYFVGVISKNKKEFLSLRLQIESLYHEYKNVEKNANNEYLVKSDEIKDSFIYLRSNAIGLLVEFYNVKIKEEIKTLEGMGKRRKIGF